MKLVVTLGIVLTRTDFGEADRILSVFTPDHGRIKLIAKGVRKVKSKLAGGIELFSTSQITFIEGRSEIATLVSSRLTNHYSHIINDIERTMLGYEFLKRVNKAVEDNAGPEYFELLNSALEALDNTDLPGEAAELWLNAQLLKLAGHSPNTKKDNQGRLLRPNQKYGFDFEHMAFAPQTAGQYGANHIKLLRLVLGLDSPLKLNNIKDMGKVMEADLLLSRTMLRHHIKL